MDHVAHTEIFNRHMIVGGKQPMDQLAEKITPLVGNTFMLPLQGHNSLASIGSALFPPGDTALRHTQAFLGSAVPGRMFNVFALAGRDERGQSNINTDIDTGGRQRLCSDFAGQDCIPLASFAGESKCLDRSWYFTMPTDSHTTNTSDFESAAINFEPIEVLFKPETLEPMFALETGITGFFPSFDTAKKCLKGFVQILHHGLQHMTVDRTSIGLGGFV